MTNTFPSFMQIASISQSQLVPDSQSHLSTLQLRQAEPCHALLVEAQIPSHGDVRLGLRLLQTLVIISFDLDERAKYILVLIRVFVHSKDRLRLVVDTRHGEVLEGGTGILAPEIFETIDLGERYLAGPELFGLAWRLDEPRQERSIIDERSP